MPWESNSSGVFFFKKKNRCVNGGSLSHYDISSHSFVCKCTYGYEGDGCESITCENGGIPLDNNSRCGCPDLFHYRGKRCEVMLCENDGLASPKLGTCLCPEMFTGLYCQYPKNSDIIPEYKSNHNQTSHSKLGGVWLNLLLSLSLFVAAFTLLMIYRRRNRYKNNISSNNNVNTNHHARLNSLESPQNEQMQPLNTTNPIDLYQHGLVGSVPASSTALYNHIVIDFPNSAEQRQQQQQLNILSAWQASHPANQRPPSYAEVLLTTSTSTSAAAELGEGSGGAADGGGEEAAAASVCAGSTSPPPSYCEATRALRISFI